MRRVISDDGTSYAGAAVEYRDIPEPRPRVMPLQKPHRSQQVVSTPWSLIHYVEKRWGKITWDLAATAGNCKTRLPTGLLVNREARYGPGARHENALKMNWSLKRGTLWLNPPFGDIGPWAEKCATTELAPDSRIVLLVPASVGSIWWAYCVDKRSDIQFLRPRVIFRKHKQGYPKDLALCVYGSLKTHSYTCVRWDGKEDK
jgi:phage N-6-adenine-methyltransferase